MPAITIKEQHEVPEPNFAGDILRWNIAQSDEEVGLAPLGVDLIGLGQANWVPVHVGRRASSTPALAPLVEFASNQTLMLQVRGSNVGLLREAQLAGPSATQPYSFFETSGFQLTAPLFSHLGTSNAEKCAYTYVPRTVTYEPSSATRRLLAANYAASNWQNVDNFILDAPFLEELLLEAHAVIEHFFGTGTKVFLEIVDEPEAPGQTELFGFLHTGIKPEEALRLLDAFDEQWWVDAVKRARGKLNFSLRYD